MIGYFRSQDLSAHGQRLAEACCSVQLYEVSEWSGRMQPEAPLYFEALMGVAESLSQRLRGAGPPTDGFGVGPVYKPRLGDFTSNQPSSLGRYFGSGLTIPIYIHIYAPDGGINQ